MMGVGTLLNGGMVLTCAHNIYYKYAGARRKASSVAVEISPDEWVDVMREDWTFPKEY